MCVPVHLLLAFLVGVANQHGYLRWFKREWVMFSWWRQQFTRLVKGEQEPAAAGAAPKGAAAAQDEQQGCAGGACCAAGAAPADGAEDAASGGGAAGSSLRSRGAKPGTNKTS